MHCINADGQRYRARKKRQSAGMSVGHVTHCGLLDTHLVVFGVDITYAATLTVICMDSSITLPTCKAAMLT